MVTKSISKCININDKKNSKSLVIALENAAKIHSKKVQLTRTYEDICGQKLKKFLKTPSNTELKIKESEIHKN